MKSRNAHHDDTNSNEEATEALVFMVVGLTGHWKAPIAYFLTKGLQACTQKELLCHALHALHDIGMRVWIVTLDGHATNQSMCSLLGCNLSSTDCSPKFSHPDDDQQQIYVMYDPCHMIKLVRNMLQAYDSILSPSGRVDWSYIKSLNNVQEEAGLRLANKLTARHINFFRQKMKVKLAVQVFSSSVASALECLQSSGHPAFTDVTATVEFVKVIYNFIMKFYLKWLLLIYFECIFLTHSSIYMYQKLFKFYNHIPHYMEMYM